MDKGQTEGHIDKQTDKLRGKGTDGQTDGQRREVLTNRLIN